MTKIIELSRCDDTFGLGFKPSRRDRMEMIEKKKQRRKARMTGEATETRMMIPSLYQTFISAGTKFFEGPAVLVVDNNDELSEIKKWVRPMEPGTEVTNWTVVNLPSISMEM